MSTLPLVIPVSNTRYELPPQGTTLLGYVVRRMHKTALLRPVKDLLATGHSAEALAQSALYAAGASASFGPAYYQPAFNRLDDEVSEADPATGARVTAWLAALRPHYRIAYAVEMLGLGRFSGAEEITGTTVSLTGLGMPAPSRFVFEAGEYQAEMVGTITSELIPGFVFTSRIRGYGQLELKDSLGNVGRLKLERSGQVTVNVVAPDERQVVRRASFAGRV
jgi:hypothetical protein